jgi:hypothetical protein
VTVPRDIGSRLGNDIVSNPAIFKGCVGVLEEVAHLSAQVGVPIRGEMVGLLSNMDVLIITRGTTKGESSFV